MPEHHSPMRKTVGARSADVVFSQLFQHRRSNLPRHHPEVNKGQGQRRQNQVLQAIPEGFAIAGQQGIEQVEAGDMGWWIQPVVQPAAAG
ncbi:hypothetical protein D3C78_1474340 [compost metagenome]